ncbi:hypothetical protein ACIBRY_28290 [Streptomyces anulatus]
MCQRAQRDGAALRLLSEVTDDTRLRAIEETGSGLGGAPLPLRRPALGGGTVHLLAARTTGASILTFIFEPVDQEL